MQNYIDDNKRAYDQIASLFSITRQYIWKDMKPLSQYVKDGDHVLDIGCGNGRLYHLFKDLSISFSGIDISSELIAIAKKQYPEGSFEVGDMRSLPYQDAQFDVVLGIASLHHLPPVGQQEVLMEVLRVLTTGGIALFTNWNFLGRWTKKRIERGRYRVGETKDHIIANFISGDKKTDAARHYWNITPDDMSAYAKKYGFTIQAQYYSKNGEVSDEKEGDNLISILRKK